MLLSMTRFSVMVATHLFKESVTCAPSVETLTTARTANVLVSNAVRITIC